MKTSAFEINAVLADALMERIRTEKWPVQVQRDLPFDDENEDNLVGMTVEHEDDFPFGKKLAETINRLYNLIPEEP
jgi:hypothetical protein